MTRKKAYLGVPLVVILAVLLVGLASMWTPALASKLNGNTFTDDFSTDLTEWSTLAGGFTLVSGNLRATALTSGAAIIVVDGNKSFQNGSITSTINYNTAGSIMGFVARYQSSGNYYFAGFQGNYMYVYRFRNDGVLYALDTLLVNLPTGSYSCTFSVIGRNLTFTVAGNTLTIVDDSLTGFSQWGLRSTGLNNEWQNFTLAGSVQISTYP